MLEAVGDGTRESLAHDGAHRAREEAKLESRGNDRHTFERARHDDERIALVRLALRLIESLAVAFAVFET